MEEELSVKRIIKPILKETYALLLDSKDTVVVEVIDVNEQDSVVTMKEIKKDKEHQFLLNDDELVMKTDNYEILDIERVIPFDLTILKEDIEQLNKQLTSDIIEGLDISLDEISEKEKVYTETEIREDVLSSLVSSFNAYDNLTLLKSLNETVDELLHLRSNKQDKTVYLYNIKNDKPLPKWLVPVVDNPMKIYSEDEANIEIMSYYNLIKSELSYSQINQRLLDVHRPVESSISDVGYYTNNLTTYFRDCLITTTCLSTKGNYSYDMRRNKQNTQTFYDNTVNITHPSDSLNIIGLLYLPQSRYTIPYDNSLFNLKESTFLNKISDLVNYKTVKNYPIISKSYSEQLEVTELTNPVFYTFSERYESKLDYHNILRKITPSIDNLLSSFDQSSSKIMNYKDFKTLSIQYEIDPYMLDNKELSQINTLINENVDNYISSVPTLKKIIFDYVPPTLDHKQKLELSLKIILSMTNIPLRNEYIQKFIKTYCRNNKSDELPNWYYSIFDNRQLICKHYDMLSIYHNNKEAFNTMITMYGKAPEDGVIHCKNCGEYLCDEDFSLFDGFSEEQPILLREEIVNEINLLENFSETDILLVKELSGCLGVSLTDEDIQLILNTHKSISQDVLANTRYGTINITVTDEHPRVKQFNKRHAKEKNKKKLISRDIKEFQLYIKDTNKIISLLSLISVCIHTSVPNYDIKKGKTLSFIEISSSLIPKYNLKYIDFIIHNTIKLCDKYNTEPFWIHYHQVNNENKQFDILSLKQQILNTLQYLISPQYPLLQERIKLYHRYLLSSKNVYVKYEWPIFKPLLKSELSTKVNDKLVEQEPLYKDNYILNYNNYPVENISMIQDIESSKDVLIHELIGLDVSEIMVNKAFLLLFNLSISNYGKRIQTVHGVDLHIERFLQTVKKQEDMRSIFKKHNWESSLKTGGLSYKTLRTAIIPEIIAYYLKVDTDLSPCFSNQKMCNQFIHVNVNNYDLHMLKTKPKRFYKYKPFVVYPEGSFEDMTEEFKDKLFKKYCKDPSGTIIKRFITTDYLGKYLIHTDQQLEEEFIGVYEHKLRKEEPNFKEIMRAVQCELPKSIYIQPKLYDVSDYTNDVLLNKTDLIKQIELCMNQNQLFELNESHPLLTTLSKLSQKDSYDDKQFSVLQRELNKSYSELHLGEFIEKIASFITQNPDKKQNKRFETIFINTSANININDEERNILQQDGFRYKNMREGDVSKVFQLFLGGDKLTGELCYHYIYTIRYILSKLSVINDVPVGVSKFWKLSGSNDDTFKNYLLENRLLLHQDIFRRVSVNRGFYKYTDALVIQGLFEYINPYLNNMEVLRKIDRKFITPELVLILQKYILSFIICKLIEYCDKLKSEDEEVVGILTEIYLKHEKEVNLLNCVSIVEPLIMDLLINMFEVHYDSRWIVSNQDLNDLGQRISKQKEKEKQQLIQELDTMSDEKRASTVELQKIGVVSMYHQAMAYNETRVIDEYSSIDEGYDQLDDKELVDAAVGLSSGEISESTGFGRPPVVQEEQGYYDIGDFDEDGVMGDEMQEMGDEDILDNNFNV